MEIDKTNLKVWDEEKIRSAKSKKDPKILDKFNPGVIKEIIQTGNASEPLTVYLDETKSEIKTDEQVQYEGKMWDVYLDKTRGTKGKKFIKYIDSQSQKYNIYEGIYSDNKSGALFTICPKCNKTVHGPTNKKSIKRMGICIDCVAERDTKTMLYGDWEDFQRKTIIKNKLSFLYDAKSEVEETLKNLSRKNTYINDDGSQEEWDNESYDSTKAFLEEQLEDISILIEAMDKVINDEITEDDLEKIMLEIQTKGKNGSK